jgi:hypothetical protein
MLGKTFFLVAILSVCAYAQTGNINVTVQDYAGKAVVGAKVTIRAVPIYIAPSVIPAPGPKVSPTPIKAAIYNAYTQTSAAGTATFSGVPVGAYSICAYPTGEETVDSCSFVPKPVGTYVKASATVAASIKLQQAARVTVTVKDALQALTTNLSKSKQLKLGVRAAQSTWVPLRSDSRLAFSQQLSALVPVNTHLSLSVGTFGLKIADGVSGRTLRNNTPDEGVSFFVPSTGAVPKLALSVLGAL